MSATIYGVNAGGFEPQNDFSATQSDKGGWTATQSYLYTRGSLSDATFRNTFAKGRRITEIDANIDDYWARLYLDRAEVSHGKGGMDRVTVYYAGYAGLEGNETAPLTTVPVYVLRGGLERVTIMAHPEVAALSDVDRGLLAGILDGLYVWDSTAAKLRIVSTDDTTQIVDWEENDPQPSAGDARTFAEKITQGIRTYNRPTFFWTKTWESETGLSAAEVNGLGKVDTPAGSPPEPNGSRDWLLVDAYEEQRGELYRNRLEWELSDRGGWDTDIYNY